MRTVVSSAAVLIVIAAGARSVAATDAGPGQRPAQAALKAAARIDPCSLLTKAEAAAAVGGAVGDGKSTMVDASQTPGMETSSCQFESPTTTHGIKLNMYRYPPSAAQAFRTRCARKETVPGLGDVACWYDSNHITLQLLKGTTSLSIALSRSGDAAEALKTIARKAVDRLP
jgi:hypothetical protein